MFSKTFDNTVREWSMHDEQIFDIYDRFEKLTFEFIEFYNIQSPSIYYMKFLMEGSNPIKIYFDKYRMKFLYQNNHFVIDTSKMKEFDLHIQNKDFLLDFSHTVFLPENREWKIILYFSINPKAE
jgi:hypothetical protein